MLMINNIGKLNGNKYQCQNDPRWKDVLLSGSNLTIGNYGCAGTCYSYVTEFFGNYLTPEQILTNPKYCKGGELQWLNLPNFRYCDGNLYSYNFQINEDMLNSYLDHDDNRPEDSERAAIIGLVITPPKGGQAYTHFVLGLWRTFDNDILIIDPWDGKKKDLYKAYGTYGRIYEVVYFRKGNNLPKDKPEAPNFN